MPSSWKQVRAVTGVCLSSLPQRAASSIVVVVGVAGVVGVLIAVLAMATGLAGTLADAGNPTRAIVLSNSATIESFSNIATQWLAPIADAPGLQRTAAGAPNISPELLVSNTLPKHDGTRAAVLIRGISMAALQVRPEWRVVAGRMFRPGLREIVVGRTAAAEFTGLGIGEQVPIGTGVWTVVGVFTSNGDVHESSLIADARTLMASMGRDTYSSVTVRLESPASFDAFKAALTTNPSLRVDVIREAEYYQEQSELVARLLFVVSNLVGVIMAVGAGFTALNTMYSAVQSRTLEIAVFRAIGFGAWSVAASVLVESLLLALLGAVIGVVLAWIFFNGNVITTFGGGMDSQIVFKLQVGPGLALQGALWACAIGVLGGLLPALRAARLSVATALRPD